jgi:uridine kinase
VHTDDVAWQHHPTDWDDLLLENVVAPWRRGAPVSYRPPAWDRLDRPEAIEVPVCDVLVVEGVGAARAAVAAHADLVVWVQSDRDEARRRGIERDIEYGRTPDEAVEFWDGWMRSEEPFLAAEQPWARAHVVALGTPPDGDGRAWVATGPAGR